MANPKEQKLLEMYALKNLGSFAHLSNPCCVECHEKHREIFNVELLKPLSAWIVGNNFDDQSKRILFVGKTGRGPGKDKNKYFYPGYKDKEHYCIDVFQDSRKELWPDKTDFWRVISNACYKIFSQKSIPKNKLIEHIAITNLIKCNCGNGACATKHIEPRAKGEYMGYNCISYLDIFRREISIINPTHIVFLTGANYDTYIKDSFDTITINPNDKIDEEFNKRWKGKGTIGGISHEIKLLRIRHPERATTEIKNKLEDIIFEFITHDKLI